MNELENELEQEGYGDIPTEVIPPVTEPGVVTTPEPEEEQSEHDLYMESLTQITDKDHDEMFGTKSVTDVDGPDEVDDLVELDTKDMDELFGVDDDVPQKKLIKITPRGRAVARARQQPPPTIMGGMR